MPLISASKETPVAPSQPLFQVVSGNPTDEEIVALTAVIMQQQASARHRDSTAFEAVQRILLRGQRLGIGLRPGAGSWRRARPQ
ncbi:MULTISPECIES: acyl-CoA carboxylase subunit epsilon [unclassified Rothia (in: high G+C Gram-positive bacteria)]|uniref:acyl-CoA carboxylase subunit epsilon n=1 Tax=unclassified Rothia (in: high G+C Gram-positive bacteria) TaxID=2689056 RepID=UPI00195B25E3|nr:MULTISPECIES: acyl-CoA carboxylase subunit epsilon [unclassified Rothia (in: high G+C Gram-positive bacteria)]MBM7051366.1 acyl-CoA carboxylase subunit epsilon [Rothia sp. ZJ1223]QRZ61160.1 acyl-CoA carboxylase subunit epsilon [Rothia sp. ZJ932]